MEKVSDIIPFFKSNLNQIGDEKEIISWAYLSIKHVLGFNRSECIVYKDQKLSKSFQLELQDITQDLSKQMPIQYILGHCRFYGLKFLLNHHVLIPRPETEELIEWILKESFSSVLDIGTGSGCIAICLAKHTNAQVNALDVSAEAIALASKNAQRNNVDVSFLISDILTTGLKEKYDVIVSNPPYVLENEKQYIAANVLDYEPHKALFVSNMNPFLFYERIINLASNHLYTGGCLFFEINERYGNQIMDLLYNRGFVDIELKKDINDKDRMIKAIWK